MSGFTEEPTMHRQAPCDMTVFVDFEDITLRQTPSEMGLRAPYPATPRPGMWDILYGDIAHRRRGAYLNDPNVYGAAGVAGTGVEEAAIFPDDPIMVKTAIKAKYDILGVVVTGFNHSTDAPDQGMVVTVGGTVTTDKYTDKCGEPGQIARVDLPPEDFAARTNPHSLSGKALGKYPWVVCPEDYTTPGESMLTHIAITLEDSDRWRQCMAGAKHLEIDKWLAAVKAACDSSLMDGLLMIYVLMRKGYLVSKNPEDDGTIDPYVLSHEQYVRSGGIVENMKPDEFVVKMSELLSVQEFLGQGVPGGEDQVYFNTLRRTILSTQYYTGKYRTFEFGREKARLLPTRDVHTGAVTKSTPQGAFLHLQLNHFKIRMGAELQALDDHVRFRLGYYISGPNRRAKVNLVLRATAM